MKNRYYSPNPHSNNYPSLKGQRILNASGKLLSVSKISKKDSNDKPLSSKSVHLCQSQKKIGVYTYDISKQIGSGFSSIVYKGLNTKTNTQCAVKIINIKKYSESSIKMLQNETKILRALNHPNIIQCLDVYKTNTHYYIITQYCSNGDLLTFIDKNGRLQQSTVKKIMSDIIQGVKYLMSKNILHRDLKPANILNGQDHWKIADFGFAIYNEGQIKTKYNVGTPLYMPLEALVQNIYSPASDIFSVGIIFYQVLTGTTPWESKSQNQLIKKMENQPYTLPSKIMVSKELKIILEEMCAIDLSKRMPKTSFMNLNFSKQNINPEQKKNKIRHAEQQKQQLQKVRSQLNFAINLNRQQVSDTKIQTQNNHILINQLHFCRFIYYFIRNISHLKVSSKNRTKLTLALFKHLRKLIKLLTEDKRNIFKLANWQIFRQSKKYVSTQITLKQYMNRYEKQYMANLKETDLDLIKQINQFFPDLSTTDPFTKSFFQNIINFLKPLIRQSNHNLTAQGISEPLSIQTKSGIEALRSLLNYYRLIQILLNNFQQFQRFEQQSNIKVQIDYAKSQITLQDYIQLRQKLKFI